MYDKPTFQSDPNWACAAPLIAVALLAEQLHRIHRGTYDAAVWVIEETFITDIIGPMQDRLEPLGNDIAKLLDQ